MEHYLIRATIIPEIIRMIVNKYNFTEKQALKEFYASATGAALSDDETGLYGQSPLYIFGLYMEEKETPLDC